MQTAFARVRSCANWWAFPTLLVAVSTALLYHLNTRLFFDPGRHIFQPYGLVYVAAIALLTLRGGRRLGFVTLSLVIVSALYVLPPRETLAVEDPLGWGELGALMMFGAAAVLIVGARREAPRRPWKAHYPTSPAMPVAEDRAAAAGADSRMTELTQWWDDFGGASRQWLILGKGPTFGRRSEYDLSGYATIAINHVVREMPVDVVSAVNYDVLRDCPEAIYRNARYLLVPRYPHPVNGVGDRPLEAFFDEFPVLEAMRREGRLIWYNLSCDPQEPGSPVVQNGLFSVCILFNLLGALGVRQVRTLGVDGGTAYAGTFADLIATTRLANGLPSYDLQFNDMVASIARFRLNWVPITGFSAAMRLKMFLHQVRHHLRPYYRRYVKPVLRKANRAASHNQK